MYYTGSIKISELDTSSIVYTQDFFPLVNSASLTTYRVNIATLNNWFAASGSALSASYSPLILQKTVTSSLYASQSVYSTSSLYASQSAVSTSSLYASQSVYSISSSYASQSVYSITSLSSSWASSSISASYITASNVIGSVTSASYSLSASYAPLSNTLADTLPIGSIIAFATGSTPPTNWLECNGAIYPTSSFLSLFTAINTTNPGASYGYLCNSNGTVNYTSGAYFKMPDFRGQFLRGWDHGRNVDAGRVMASLQTSDIQPHNHTMTFGGFNPNRASNAGDALFQTPGEAGSSILTLNTNTAGGSETRPTNVAVMYCIKYSNAANYINMSGSSVSGDVIGNLTGTTVVGIQNIPVSSSTPALNNVLAYNGSQWAPTAISQAGFIKAFGTLYAASPVANKSPSDFIPFSGSYNIISASYQGNTTQRPNSSTAMQTSSAAFPLPNYSTMANYGNYYTWIVYMQTPLPSVNYTVIATAGGEQTNAYIGGFTNFPSAGRTTTAFSMSVNLGDPIFANRTTAYDWLGIMVLHM